MEILEILGKIGFDWRVALANFVNFLLILWVLNRFVFSPLFKRLGERKQVIDEGIENAQIAERDKVMAKQKAEDIVAKSKSEANSILAESKKKGDDLIKSAQDRALEEAGVIISSTKEKMESERKDMERDIKERSADLVVEGVEKMLKKEITSDKNNNLVKALTS